MWVIIMRITEAAIGGVLQQKVLLKISQNLQENTCVGVSFSIKLNNFEFKQLYL